jgi:hypothetical protein
MPKSKTTTKQFERLDAEFQQACRRHDQTCLAWDRARLNGDVDPDETECNASFNAKEDVAEALTKAILRMTLTMNAVTRRALNRYLLIAADNADLDIDNAPSLRALAAALGASG